MLFMVSSIGKSSDEGMKSNMRFLKEGKSKKGRLMHYSVGAIIERDGKYLLIDRAIPPFGFACVAGHVDKDEETEHALLREVKEEVGLKIKKYELVGEEELDWNWCNKGSDAHRWHVFRCEVSGKIKIEKGEVKSFGWFTKDEIKKLKLEPSWDFWLKKLGII